MYVTTQIGYNSWNFDVNATLWYWLRLWLLFTLSFFFVITSFALVVAPRPRTSATVVVVTSSTSSYIIFWAGSALSLFVFIFVLWFAFATDVIGVTLFVFINLQVFIQYIAWGRKTKAQRQRWATYKQLRCIHVIILIGWCFFWFTIRINQCWFLDLSLWFLFGVAARRIT